MNDTVRYELLNQKEQIDELNSTVKCKLAPSKIHGIGVFALRDIRKGEKLYCRINHFVKWYYVSYGSLSGLFPEIKELVLERWPSIINGSRFVSPNDMVWLITFMNHSSQPNYDVISDCALSDIAKGMEVTEDYRLMDNYAKIYPWLSTP